MRYSTKVSVALWTVQGLLAALFLFAGVMKLVTPAELMEEQSGMAAWFIQFIGVCETLGALGLIVPGLVRVRAYLTSVAAVGLVTIMIGATVLGAASGQIVAALIPFVVGILCALVAYTRRPVASRRVSSRHLALQPAS